MIMELDRNLKPFLENIKAAKSRTLLDYHDIHFDRYCYTLWLHGYITWKQLEALNTKALCTYLETRDKLMKRGAWT